MNFTIGSLVKARGREWVVLGKEGEETLIVRPLGGTDDEVTGIHLPIEPVEPAWFALPDPTKIGDYRSCRLLRDAVRLGFRSSAGPFRSFARIAVEPRPYQLVPLLMALKLNPVRMLIADDVGIGKTIEAALIARELIDRDEVDRLAVLCPPHLAEQWQAELRDKFHLDAVLVLPSTVTRLERDCRSDESLFDIFPYVVVSTDFIKSERRRDEFLRTCPKLVIIDEAHTCAYAGERKGGRHQRHRLVSTLAADESRHMILVTATPHSGNEEAFRSLLTFLNKDFANLPEDLTGRENEHNRRRLAAHFVQRRRGDIQHYLDADTPFPEREDEDREETYRLSDEYKRFFERVLKYARETVLDPTGINRHRQRVRWWSALSLLQSLASSPAAAAATLRSRAITADTQTLEEADDLGRRAVLDLLDDESMEGFDLAPGCDIGAAADDEQGNRRRLLAMAREADALIGAKDRKLQKAVKLVEELLADGFRPILFCRFIETAEYVAKALRKHLSKGVEVEAVTGRLAPAERESRIVQLAESKQHVLVATDCLSEGVNLQDHFDAVLHYDLSWNPTRHEQREGRVDRYGQPCKKVRAITYYGLDNQIDGIMLDVLIRKHRKIRSSLGISVPVPVDTEQVVQAIFEGLLLRDRSGDEQQALLPGFEDYLKPQKQDLYRLWDTAYEREKRSRTMFAQETIKVDEVARELQAVRAAVGSNKEVDAFTWEAFRANGASASRNGVVHFNLSETPRALREAVGVDGSFTARFELPVHPGEIYLSRTHPIVEGLASYVMEVALDSLNGDAERPVPLGDHYLKVRRAGVIRTNLVERRTTLLLLRFRYHIITRRGDIERPLLAEDCQMLAFSGSPQNAQWLDVKEAETLLSVPPSGNILAEQASEFLRRVTDNFEAIRPQLDRVTAQRGEELLDAHRRVRAAARMSGTSYRIEPQFPPDVLGVYIYVP